MQLVHVSSILLREKTFLAFDDCKCSRCEEILISTQREQAREICEASLPNFLCEARKEGGTLNKFAWGMGHSPSDLTCFALSHPHTKQNPLSGFCLV